MLIKFNFEKAINFSLFATIFSLPFTVAGMEMFSFVTIILFVLKSIKNKTFLDPRDQIVLLCLLLFLSSSISIIFSDYLQLSLRGLLKLGKFLLIMLIVRENFQKKENTKALIRVALVGLIFLIVDSIYQYQSGYDLFSRFPVHYTDEQIRLTGSYKSYGLLAAHLIGWIPILISILWNLFSSKEKKFNKIAFSFFLLFSLFVLYKTHSRGAWVALWLSLIIYSIFLKNKLLMTVLIALIFVVPYMLPKNALIHLNLERQEQSILERYRLWERAAQVIIKRPLFGCGINTFTKSYSVYDEVKNWRVPGYQAHNGYLQLAAETGLVSLFLFLMIIYRALNTHYKSALKEISANNKRLRIGLLAGLIALLLQAGADTTLSSLQSAMLIWFCLGLCLSFKSENL